MRTLQWQILLCKRVQWGSLAIMIGALLLFVLVGYLPAIYRQRALQASIAQDRAQLEENQRSLRNIHDLERQVARLQQQQDSFNKQLPRTQDIGQFIKDINAVSQQAQLHQLESFSPGLPVRNDYYVELPIHMKCQGDFYSIFNFLKQCEEMQQLTRIKSINIRGTDPKLGQVEVKLTMNIYCSEG